MNAISGDRTLAQASGPPRGDGDVLPEDERHELSQPLVVRLLAVGTGPARGMASIFIVAGVIGLLITVAALRSGPYRRLSRRYAAG